MAEIKGKIHGVSGPTVIASGMQGALMNTVCHVGPDALMGEIIRIKDDKAVLQVYEDTTGLKVGQDVTSQSTPLTVTLGPGLLSNIFDGIQRPLPLMYQAGDEFVRKGTFGRPLDRDAVWKFEPLKKAGDRVAGGETLGVVAETERIVHRIMAPPEVCGTVSEIRSGSVKASEPVCLLEGGREIFLYQEWPVRVPRPYAVKLPSTMPFSTGQRVFDTLIPVAKGGTAIVPGGFGTGKTIVQQTIARFASTDIVVYIGCGERGNEMTEILTDFPRLMDPQTGLALSLRTVIVVNTSNMPVAGREASIFTGMTIAEYFRDMGYSVAVLADSISRWAEALREISSRLEEMPGEEGFPPNLASSLGGFYERAGMVRCLGPEARTGSVTVVSAVSPPGGDLSEPVTQASLRFAGTFWALDAELAYRRHFPAVNWLTSFSLYDKELEQWFSANVAPDMVELRDRLFSLLQRQNELKEIVQIIGVEALQESDRLLLEAAGTATDVFLRQSVFNENDAFNTYDKQYWLLKAVFSFYDCALLALKRGVYLETVLDSHLRVKIRRLVDEPSEGFPDKARALIREIETELCAVR